MSLGDIAQNIVEFLSVAAEILYVISYGLGIAFLLGSIIQFQAHRRNPVQVRISQLITLLLIGLFFIAAPLIVQLSESTPMTKEKREEKITKESKPPPPQKPAPPSTPGPKGYYE